MRFDLTKHEDAYFLIVNCDQLRTKALEMGFTNVTCVEAGLTDLTDEEPTCRALFAFPRDRPRMPLKLVDQLRIIPIPQFVSQPKFFDEPRRTTFYPTDLGIRNLLDVGRPGLPSIE